MAFLIGLSLGAMILTWREKNKLGLSAKAVVSVSLIWLSLPVAVLVIESSNPSGFGLPASVYLSTVLVMVLVGSAGRPGLYLTYLWTWENEDAGELNESPSNVLVVWFTISLLLSWSMGMEIGGHW